ncbi:tail fiber domain-containing protein [Enterobacter asburiae]|uniref:tail fiber domain-containing protein n=1 Tax=Enterobacter asburiae TaxID=61645 RepID=UPI00210CCA76|nr:tail fiber domain-containing protein [Enterobacter asburiae]MCQ4369228.1 tail fiber domain-containing protein [Enterobacter asburiae]
MSAGTITLTNGSAVVGGTGTSFTTELTAGDFIVSTVGGVPYTLPVKTVDSNSQLTLLISFTGPTQAGAAWSAVPRVALNMVTAALVAQSAEALRGLNYDKQNWQQVYSAAGNITVKLPDGTTFTGPSWKYLSDNMATKSGGSVPVNQGGTGSTTASGARTNLGLGSSATKDVGTAAGTVAAGDDSRLGTVNGKTGGTISSAVTINGVGGGATDWHTNAGGGLGVRKGNGGDNSIEMNNTTTDSSQGNYVNQIVGKWYSGSWAFGAIRSGSTPLDRVQLNVVAESGGAAASFMFYPDGRGTGGQWVSLSDARIKKDIVRISDPLVKMRTIKGCCWERIDNETTGYGFIAQDVEQVFPEAVKGGYDITLKDGTVIPDVKTVDTYGVAAALHHEAILAMLERIESLEKKVARED